MLIRLEITGFPLLSEAAIEFSRGLNVLTGETGAGKSLVLRALGCLLGRGGEAAFLRRGARATEAAPRVAAEIDTRTIDPELLAELRVRAGKLRVERAFHPGGRSRASIDGRAVALSDLGRLMQRAVAFTGQGAARDLVTPEAVLDVLDGRAGLRARVAEYRERLLALRRTEAELGGLCRSLELGARHGARLGPLLDEIDELAPRRGEHAELARRIAVLERAQHYLALCARLNDALFAREIAVEAELSQLLGAVRRAPELASSAEIAEDLGAALAALERVARSVARTAEDLVAEPAELSRLEQRLDTFERLAARLGVAPDELADHGELLRSEQRGRAETEERLAALEAARVEHERAARELALDLHERRERALGSLERRLRAELAALCLGNAELALGLTLRGDRLGPSGSSELALGFSANPGEPLLPLGRVASGGERSRVVLALSCAGAVPGRALVFDEIEQGVGGDSVDALGERLARLGREQQVLCVTHQAAIAARAERHLRVKKQIANGRTTTEVSRLSDEERTLELSRMLAGGCAADDARVLARRLLKAARAA